MNTSVNTLYHDSQGGYGGYISVTERADKKTTQCPIRRAFRTATVNGVMEIIDRICLRDVIRTAIADGGDAAEALTLTTESPAVVARVAACEIELNRFKQRQGIFTKKSVLMNAKAMPPADWWDLYGAHLPILSGVAKSVLAQTVCASAAERNWSIYGQVKSKERSRMSHGVGDKLVYCHEALHLQEKLQTASYKAKVEEWDSDSDSAESEDEEDLAV